MFSKIMENLEKYAQDSLDNSVQAQVAQQLGWALVAGKNAALAKPVLTLAIDADKAGADVLQDSEKYENEKAQHAQMLEAFEKFPGAALFTKMMQVVCGRMREQDVYIFPGSEGGSENSSSRKKLDIVILLRGSLDLKLHMYPEYWFSKVGKFLFRLQDVHIGDERIDEAFMIKTEKSKVAQQALRKEEVRSAFYELLDDNFESPVINDVSIRNTIYLPSQAENIVWHIGKLAALGEALSGDLR